MKSILKNTNVTPFKYKNGTYYCFYCNANTGIFDELRNHTSTEHNNDREEIIDNLNEESVTDDIIRVDIANLKCTLCSEPVQRWSSLAKHLDLHELNIERSVWYYVIPYILRVTEVCCALCNSNYGHIMPLDKHMCRHYKNIMCQECGEGFLTQQQLNYHVHKKVLKGQECSCDLCEEFVEKEVVIEPVAKKSNTACNYCPETFKDYYKKYLHMLQCHRQLLKEYNCADCGKVFFWKPFYLAHIKVHK